MHPTHGHLCFRFIWPCAMHHHDTDLPCNGSQCWLGPIRARVRPASILLNLASKMTEMKALKCQKWWNFTLKCFHHAIESTCWLVWAWNDCNHLGHCCHIWPWKLVKRWKCRFRTKFPSHEKLIFWWWKKCFPFDFFKFWKLAHHLHTQDMNVSQNWILNSKNSRRKLSVTCSFDVSSFKNVIFSWFFHDFSTFFFVWSSEPYVMMFRIIMLWMHMLGAVQKSSKLEKSWKFKILTRAVQ